MEDDCNVVVLYRIRQCPLASAEMTKASMKVYSYNFDLLVE